MIWNQSSLARSLDVSFPQSHRYLIGERYPSLKIMRRIERMYGWPLMDQISLIPDDGHNQEYGDALRKFLDGV